MKKQYKSPATKATIKADNDGMVYCELCSLAAGEPFDLLLPDPHATHRHIWEHLRKE